MKRALELKPNEFAFLENTVGALVLAEDFAEALEFCRKALAQQPHNPNLLYLNAASLQKLDRLDEARVAFVALLRLAPAHLWGRKEYAVTLTRLGEIDEARRVVETLVAEHPRFADAYLVRANISSIRGEYGPAFADYQRALALQPNAHETWLSYGRALNAIGRYEGALAAFDRALALRPNYADALIGRGAALKMMNRLPEALACFDQAIALGGDAEAKGLAARGSALAEAGETEEAREILRRAAESGARIWARRGWPMATSSNSNPATPPSPRWRRGSPRSNAGSRAKRSRCISRSARPTSTSAILSAPSPTSTPAIA